MPMATTEKVAVWPAVMVRLAGWVLMAQAAGLSYGLQLPACQINLGRGHEHCERCLEALALYESSGH